MLNLKSTIMKTLVKILFVLICLGLSYSCAEPEDMFEDTQVMLKKGKKKHHGLDQERYVVMKNHDKLKVHYRIIGKGSIDVVFIPGWTNPLTVYSKQFDYFRKKARCIYIDLPGTGLSDAPTPNTPLAPIPGGHEYTMELMADAVHAVIKKEGLHKFVGVGFSMGPKVLGMFERNYPRMMKKLVILDGGFDPWPTEEPARQDFINTRETSYGEILLWNEAVKTAVGGSLIPPSLTGPLADELKEWGTYFPAFPTDVLANTNYHSKAENANEPVGWKYPKLCIYSKAVEDLDMDKINLIYPNNTVYGFPGGGHVIQWIFHKEINPLIWDFIDDKHGKKPKGHDKHKGPKKP
jgi:pimeloyl-ACP methyl ester carboxylesterase